jgi:hypothetical protein
VLAKTWRRYLFSGCLINSLPKAGTHLLAKVVAMLAGVRVAGFLNAAVRSQTFASSESGPVMIPVGVGNPRMVPRDRIRRVLEGFGRGSFVIAHVPFSQDMAALLTEMDIRMVSIIRDPRDVIVSHAEYVAKIPGTAIYDHYRPLSEAERIMVSAVGVWKEPDGPFLRNIRDRLTAVLAWASQPLNYLTSFERLVGPRGGGSLETQLHEIRAISRHLGLRCSDAMVRSVAERAFGGADTFRQGLIGSWRERCTEEHKRALKELIGQFLIDLGYEKGFDW